MYDITDQDSFQKMAQWVKELRAQCGQQLPIIIVGNKNDLENMRQIDKKTAEDYAKQISVDHFSCSARTGNNVNEVFKSLTERIVVSKAANKTVKNKANTRGMLNVKGIDIDNDSDGDNGMKLRRSTKRKASDKKGCAC